MVTTTLLPPPTVATQPGQLTACLGVDSIRWNEDPLLATVLKVNRIYVGISKCEKPSDATQTHIFLDGILDLSSTLRIFGDLCPGTKPFISGPIAQGVGLTTAFLSVQGAFLFLDALKRREFAASIGDQSRVHQETANLIKDGTLIGAGVAYGAFRSLRIAAFYKGIDIGPHAHTALGRTTYSVAAAGNAVLGIYYLTHFGTTGYRLINSVKLRYGLTAEILREKLKDLSLDEVSATEEELKEVVKSRAADWLGQVLGKMEEYKILSKQPHLTEEERKEIAWKLLEKNEDEVVKELRSQWPEIAERLLALHNQNPLFALGHALKIDAERVKRTNDLTELLGVGFVEKLKNKGEITEDDVAEAKAILNKGILWQTFNLLLCIAGVLWVIYSYISDSVSNGIYAIQSAVCLLLDGKGIKDWIDHVQSGKSDVRMIMMSLATAVISIVLVALLFTYFGLPVWMLISALLVDSAWVGLNLFTLYKMNQPNLKNPTLDDFNCFLQSCIDDKKINEVFGRLNETIQNKLKEMVDSQRERHHLEQRDCLTSVELRYATKLLLAKRTHEDKRALERFKEHLLPLIPSLE